MLVKTVLFGKDHTESRFLSFSRLEVEHGTHINEMFQNSKIKHNLGTNVPLFIIVLVQ